MANNIEQVIRAYLPQIVHMSLGTSQNNKPWVCEVHFEGDKGQKIQLPWNDGPSQPATA